MLKFTHSLQISKAELVTLIHTCGKIGYKHFMQYGQWVPQHLKPSSEEEKAFEKAGVGQFSGKAAKYFSKIANVFEERKYRVGHLFVGMRRWHLLFLELQDINNDNNHWVEGSHVHFTNDLCSPLDIDDVSIKFTSLDFEIGKRLHIRFNNSIIE